MNKHFYNFRTDEQKLEDYNKSDIYASIDDMELDEIISRDMGTIWEEVDGQDGMYLDYLIILKKNIEK